MKPIREIGMCPGLLLFILVILQRRFKKMLDSNSLIS